MPGLGTGLPVPPWTVDYDTGEVTGASDNNTIPLTLTGAGNVTAQALRLVADSTAAAKALIIEAGDSGPATGIEATIIPGAGGQAVGMFFVVGGASVTGSDLYGQDVTVEGYDGVIYGSRYGLTGDGAAFGVGVNLSVQSATGVGKGFFCDAGATGDASVYGADLDADVTSGDGDAFGAQLSASVAGAGTAYALKCLAGNVEAQLATGETLTVKDSGGNPVFEVREDGTVHILTAGTIVADL